MSNWATTSYFTSINTRTSLKTITRTFFIKISCLCMRFSKITLSLYRGISIWYRRMKLICFSLNFFAEFFSTKNFYRGKRWDGNSLCSLSWSLKKFHVSSLKSFSTSSTISCNFWCLLSTSLNYLLTQTIFWMTKLIKLMKTGTRTSSIHSKTSITTTTRGNSTTYS